MIICDYSQRFLISLVRLVSLCILLTAFWVMPVLAQDTQIETEPSVQDVTEKVDQQSAGPGSNSDKQNSEKIDAALEAFEAAEKAEEEAQAAKIAAAKKLLEASSTEDTRSVDESQNSEEVGSDAEPNGPSLLDPERLRELGRTIGSKVIGWLTSPSFLAQLAALALAYFLAPILSKQIRERVFLFSKAPADNTRFKLIRDYIFRAGNFLKAVMLVSLLALFALILENIEFFGDSWLVKIAQGLAVVFLLYCLLYTSDAADD